MTTLLADVKFHISSAPFSGGLGYLAVVLALHRAMAYRKTPVSIPKGVLVLYNVVQVVVNAYVAYAIAHAVGGWVFGLGVRESPAVRHGVYLHYLCKYLDMFDTVIIALRKKSEQLSFLHLYHHSTIVVVWGWVVHTWPAEGSSAVYSYGAWINSVVHVVMYFYYGLTAVGIRPPFKKAVTIFQLSQFGSCIVHALAVRPPLAPRRLPARTRLPSPSQLPAYRAAAAAPDPREGAVARPRRCCCSTRRPASTTRCRCATTSRCCTFSCRCCSTATRASAPRPRPSSTGTEPRMDTPGRMDTGGSTDMLRPGRWRRRLRRSGR